MTNLRLALYTVSQKNCAKLFLPELRQISTNFHNFWQKDDKEAKIMRGALTFHGEPEKTQQNVFVISSTKPCQFW